MSLERFFHPNSIAVVGASRDLNKIGTIVIQNLLDGGYHGTIYPINPHAEQILELPVYANITDCPTIPELVVISLPAPLVKNVLQQIIDVGVKQVIILTAGFKEVGGAGGLLEKEIQEMVEKAGVTLLGPNCLGFTSVTHGINATFARAKMLPGSLKLLSQSGAIVASFFDRSATVQLGMDLCVTVGNKAGLTEVDLLHYRDDSAEAGAPIGMYLESIDDGPAFVKAVRQLTPRHPVFLLKPGKSHYAQAAMQSHTGSIAGSEEVLEAVCKQTGVIRCETIQDLFDCSVYFSRQPAPQGKRVAIISNAGGPAVIATDLLEKYGLELANLSSETQQRLRACLPRSASVTDPVDLLGDAPADRYEQALQIVLEDPADVDAVLVILTPQVMTEIEKTAQSISEYAKKYNLPIVASFIGNEHVLAGQQILHQQQVPCFPYPERAIKVIAHAANRSLYRVNTALAPSSPRIRERVLTTHLPRNAGLLSPEETDALLAQVGLTTPRTRALPFDDNFVTSTKEFVQEVGYPIVMKLTGSHLLHKIDVGGIMTDIWNDDLLEKGLAVLQERAKQLTSDAHVVHLQLQEQIQDGVELIVGYKKDPTFGELILIGPGGTLTNILPDHQIAILPVSRDDLHRLVKQTYLWKVLEGWRGHPAYAIEQLLTFLEGFVQLVQKSTRIDHAEINPIIVTTQAVYAVDPKIVLS